MLFRSVVQYREEGYLPEALVNFLSLLGWSPEDTAEIFSLDELVSRFSLDRVSKSPAVFNFDKLKWMNSHYIKALPPEQLLTLCLPHLQKSGLVEEDPSAERLTWLAKVTDTLREKLEFAAQVPELAAVFFGDSVERDAEDEDASQVMALETSTAVIRAFRERALESSDWDGDTVRQVLKEIGKELGVKGKALFMTVRVAVSGQSHGPDLNALLTLLGPETVARRLENTLKHL